MFGFPELPSHVLPLSETKPAPTRKCLCRTTGSRPDPDRAAELKASAYASLTSLYTLMDPSVRPHVRKRIEDYINHLERQAHN